MDQTKQKKPSVITLLLVYGFPACVTVALSPALSSIQADYHIDQIQVRDIMFVAMVAYALGPLFSAPVSLKLGRKGAVLLGCFIALAGSIFSVIVSYSHNYDLFLLARFIMTFGSAVAFVLAYTIINDSYEKKEAHKILSIIAAAFCILPGIVMAISGQLISFLGWESINIFLLLYTIVTIIFVFRMPETGKQKFPFFASVKETFFEYKELLTTRSFWYCMIITALAISALYVYATDASIISTTNLGLSPSEFGYLSLVPYMGALVSLFLVEMFSKYITDKALTVISCVLVSLAALALLFCFLIGWLNAWVLFGCTFFLIAGTMPLNVTYITIAESHSEYRGAVASLIGFAFMAMSVLATKFSSWINPLLGYYEYPATLLVIAALLIIVFTVMMIDKKGGRSVLED